MTCLRTTHKFNVYEVVIGIVGILVVIVLSLALLPTITSQVAVAQADPNLTATEGSFLPLLPLFYVIGISLSGLVVLFLILREALGH